MTYIEQAIKFELPFAEIFFDPAFWQALGKARGWPENDRVSFNKEIGGNPVSAWFYTKLGSLYHWHRFIDHLAAGGDAESFFADLLSA